jgi:hypothetical protein
VPIGSHLNMQVLKILRLETNLPGHAIHSLRTVCVSVSKPKVNAEIRVTVFVSSRLRHCVTPGHIIDTHNGTSAYTARVKDRSTGKRVISLTFRSLYRVGGGEGRGRDQGTCWVRGQEGPTRNSYVVIDLRQMSGKELFCTVSFHCTRMCCRY